MPSPNILVKLAPPEPTPVYDTYWRFAAERQEVFFRRLQGNSPPWTEDSILQQHKFTNVYRASDRVSQFLIRNVLYHGIQAHDDTFFRCILFKIFNRESTWRLLEEALGEISYSKYSYERYNRVLDQARSHGVRIFSAAYIMPTHAADFHETAKHRNYLAILEKMMADQVPSRIARATSMRAAFEILVNYPLIGNFLAYQFATDINYSELTNFSEMEFVMPGPGAKDGIRKCFTTIGDLSEADVIRFVTDRQDAEFARLGLRFHSLWGRRLQLIDCQNLFCEVGKYARVAHPEFNGLTGRKRIKQRFTANSQLVHYMFPPKWGINQFIQRESENPVGGSAFQGVLHFDPSPDYVPPPSNGALIPRIHSHS